MPSLIYITRIQPLSAEQAQALESSGVHVKSFGAGEITADECVLVMTSEAVLAGLQLSGLGSFNGTEGAKGPESRGGPSLEDIQKHLGADAAIWNCIKAGKVSESAAVESKATAERRSSVSPAVPAADNLGFVAGQAGMRALAASQLLPVTGKKPSETNDRGRAETPGLQTLRPPAGEQPPKSLWQPAALVAVLSVLAVVLLAGRSSILPSTADIAAVDNRSPGEQSDSGAASLIHKGSTVRSSPKASTLTAEGRRHISDYDFVAEDYTTHFDLHVHPAVTTQTPGQRHGAPNRPVRKRVVVD